MNRKQVLTAVICTAVLATSVLAATLVLSADSGPAHEKTATLPESSVVIETVTESLPPSQIKFQRDPGTCLDCWKNESFVLDYGQFNEYDGFGATRQGMMQALGEMGIGYSQDSLIHHGGWCMGWQCEYCSYALADDGKEYYGYSSSGVGDHPSGIGSTVSNTVRIMDSHSETCRPNYNSCMCSLEQEIAARFGPELSYFDEEEEKEVAGLVRQEFETNVANVPSEFELVVGKYNFDYGQEYTEFCGKTSFGREFSGVLLDGSMVDFSITIENSGLCAYSEGQNRGELKFGWDIGGDVFVSKPKFLFPSSQDEDIAAAGNTVYVAMATPHILGILVMASHDGGFSFGNPEIVNKDQRGIAQNPAVSVLGSSVYVAWEETVDAGNGGSGGSGGGEEKESRNTVKIAKSTDRARSFSEPTLLKSFPETSVISDFELLPYGSNTVYAAWVSSAQDSSKLYLAASHDGGKTFLTGVVHESENALQNINLDECIPLTCIRWTESGIAYEKTVDQDGSFDRAAPTPLLPMIKPGTVAYDGNFYTVWRDDQGTSSSILFAKGPAADKLYDNAVKIVDMQLAAGTGTNNMQVPTGAKLPEPVVAAGNNTVYVAWKHPHNGIMSTWLAVSTDGGSAFSEPIVLNEGLDHSAARHPVMVATENKMYLSYTGYFEGEGLSKVHVVEATRN